MFAGFPHGVDDFYDTRILSTAGPSPGKGTYHGTPDFLPHYTNRWAFHLLQRGRPERRADTSPAARTSLIIADVRASVRPAFRSLSPYRARLPGFRTQRVAGPKNIRVYLRSLRRDHESLHRSSRALALHALHAGLRRPVGFRMALAHPDRIEALIIQDAVAHNEGLGANWKTRRAFWANRAANESTLRTNLLSLATTRTRHVGNDPNVERYDPDLWTDEFAFLNQPGQADIQSDLFYDYRTNVDAYPKWQAWMREKQPRLLVLWGKYDLSFELSEPEAYRGDVPKAEVHVLDAGHFALDTAADEIAALVRGFLGSPHCGT
jgi:alpha/beta hydrolase family protein